MNLKFIPVYHSLIRVGYCISRFIQDSPQFIYAQLEFFTVCYSLIIRVHHILPPFIIQLVLVYHSLFEVHHSLPSFTIQLLFSSSASCYSLVLLSLPQFVSSVLFHITTVYFLLEQNLRLDSSSLCYYSSVDHGLSIYH